MSFDDLKLFMRNKTFMIQDYNRSAVIVPLLQYLLNFDLRVALGNIVIFVKFYLWESST